MYAGTNLKCTVLMSAANKWITQVPIPTDTGVLGKGGGQLNG